ncbi:MAG: PAS domain S-box protein [Rhizobiaceae bacterium]
MASESYSFIDIAVADPVRERFAAGDSLIILSSALDEIVWANGPGAAVLGYGAVEAAIGSPSGLGAPATRQIRATRGFPAIPADHPVSVRLIQGLTSRIVVFLASGITLPGGESAILLAVPADETAKEPSAERAVSGFASDDYIAAIVDAEGKIEAASRDAAKLGLGREAILELVREVARQEDRLVKKLVTAGTRQIPAGIARLRDDPALHLLVIVEPIAEEDAEKSQPAEMGDERHVSPPREQSRGAEAEKTSRAAPANGNSKDREHEDHWYFKSEDEREPASAPLAVTRSDGEEAARRETTPALRPAASLPSNPMKFVWRTDADGRFDAISDEFVRTLGGSPDEIVGRRFGEVAAELGFDVDGEIARLLEHRDTWSGRSVLWPVRGTTLSVPVDLAGLPIYGRDRVFEGFRGFGVARFGEAMVTPSPVRGTEATPPSAEQEKAEASQTAANDGMKEAAIPPKLEEQAEADPEEHDPFKGEPPALTVKRGPERRFSDKIIRLAEHRPPLPEGGLSSAERHAFQEIGARLKKESVVSTPERDGREEVGSAAVPLEEPTAAPAAAAEPEGQVPAAEDAPEITPLESAEADGARPPSDAESTNAERGPSSEASKEPRGGKSEEHSPEMRSDASATDAAPSAFFLPVHIQPEFYATILSRLPLPILVHAGDVLHYANPYFLDLTGYSSLDEVRSAGGLGELFADPPAAASDTGHKLCLKHRSGEIFPVEALLQSVPWENGKALLMALRRAEKQPRQAAAEQAPADATADVAMPQSRLDELRAIIDTATDGVVLMHKDGTIRSISRPAEALFGFDSADVAGKPFASLFAIESQRAAREYLSSLSDNGVASVLNDGLELIGREAEGRFIPLFMTIGRLPDENGYCAVVRDITQWKRAEEELTQARALAERSSSQKTDFLARVSHEIRTPLNAIIGFSELIMDEKFGPVGNERYRDYLRDINRSGNHVLDLVNDLLDISKIEAGEQEMNYEAVSLNETLAETVAMMQPQANRERVIIRSSFLSRLPEVVADLRSMRQVALNLLSNAIRYTQAGGQVIVSTAYEPSGEVVMRVRDTGVGMSQVEIEQALKPFKQLNALKRPRGDGTGLGLPLTKAMVEANRARFSINSTPGEGTLVEISFPSTRVLAD